MGGTNTAGTSAGMKCGHIAVLIRSLLDSIEAFTYFLFLIPSAVCLLIY